MCNVCRNPVNDDPLWHADCTEEEPGRYVNGSGQIITRFPPEGRFVALWRGFDALYTDTDKHDLIALLHGWRDENSTLVAYSDGDEWVEVEPLPDTIPDDWKDTQ